MATPAVPLVEKLGIYPIQLPHAEGKVAVGCFYEKMKVISHQAVGVANPIITLIDMLEGVQEVLTVLIIFEYWLFFIAAGRDMIHCTGVLDTEWSGHGRRLSAMARNVKPQDLTLKVPSKGSQSSLSQIRSEILANTRASSNKAFTNSIECVSAVIVTNPADVFSL